MSTKLKEQVRSTIWSLIEEHYNVDRRLPHTLTAKRPLEANPIDQIADKFTTAISQIIAAQVEATIKSLTPEPIVDTLEPTSQESPQESPPENKDLEDHSHEHDGSTWFYSTRGYR